MRIPSENHSLGLNYSSWRFPYIPARRRRWFRGFNILQVLNFSNGRIGPTGCCCGREGWPHFTNLYSSLPLILSSSSLQNFPQFSLASFDIQNALSPFWHLFMVKHYLLGKTAYNICTEDEGILWTVSTLAVN